MTRILAAEDAVACIPDGATVASVGVIGWITPDRLLAALGARHARTGSPTGLTFFFPVGTGDAIGIKGMDHVARRGLMKRIVSGSYINPVDPRSGERPALMRLIRDNAVEAYSWPIGATMHWLREVARRSPGYLTRVGLGTYVDPLYGGGRFTACATEDLVHRVEVRGETMLFYPSWPIDVAFIRASSADRHGNLSFEDEPLVSSTPGLVLATKASGGRVIAQVRQIVADDARQASAVSIPGMFVDDIVVDPGMMAGTDTPSGAAYVGATRVPLSSLPRLPMTADKVIARRAAREVRRRELSIFGFGAAADIPLAMAEQGAFADGLADWWFTTEHGSYGGIVMPGWQFSANINPMAIIDGLYQFDAIDGGLCRFAALAFAEFDAEGVVNVSRFGSANPGAGGFTDIAENARRIVLTGTFTTGGLEVGFDGGRLRILREGRVRKFVRKAASITYRLLDGVRERGQRATIVTERAVFDVTPRGVVLTEIAPGIEIERDILAQMEFPPVSVATPPALMDAALFTEERQAEPTAPVSGD